MLVQAGSFTFSESLLGGRGKQALAAKDALLRHVEQAPDHSITLLDLCLVEFLDFSAADEIIAKALLRLRGGELSARYIVLQGVGEAPYESLYAALVARDLVVPARRCECPTNEARQSQPERYLIGELPQPLLETYRLALERNQLTARHVADAFDLKISASSNRLTKLQEMRLLHRTGDEVIERGGKQYIYEPIF